MAESGGVDPHTIDYVLTVFKTGLEAVLIHFPDAESSGIEPHTQLRVRTV